MSWLQVVVLSIVQGLTEFLPISSSSHLAIVSRVFFSADAGASFTAVSQLGTEAAVVIYFARDIWRILKAWFNGLFVKAHRDNIDYRMGWYVIIGTVPIVVIGLAFKEAIRGEVRNLWVIATAMLLFSAVIAAAEYFGKQTRHVEQLTWKDGLIVGVAQCLALIPGCPGPARPSVPACSLALIARCRRDSASCLAFRPCWPRACSHFPTHSIR